jgi:hypothetical protein
MATNWWVIVPQADAALPGGLSANAVVFSTASGSADDNTLSGSTGSITYKGKPYVRYFGPYATKALAQAADTPGNQGTSFVPNPLQGLDSIGATLSAVWDKLRDGKMWRSLAWIIIGVNLVVLAVILMLRKPIADVAGTAIGAAVKAP